VAGADGVDDARELHDRDVGDRGRDRGYEDREGSGRREECPVRSQHAKVYWIQRVPVNRNPLW